MFMQEKFNQMKKYYVFGYDVGATVAIELAL